MRRDINRDSPARQDGRSPAPEPPKEFFYFQVADAVNQKYPALYKVEDLIKIDRTAPDFFRLLLAWVGIYFE